MELIKRKPGRPPNQKLNIISIEDAENNENIQTQTEELCVNKELPILAEEDMWRYNPDIEPRIFLKGEAVPDGWTGPIGILQTIWFKDDMGRWVKKL